jgi:endo-1,4-beta-xylanase
MTAPDWHPEQNSGARGKSATRRNFLYRAMQSGAAALIAPALSGCAAHLAARVAAGPAVQPTSGADSLRAQATARGFLTGTAVNVHALETDPGYAALVREQSSIVVAENEMKWASLRPSIDSFSFDQADKLIAFAEENRIKVRGHNLCWHRQLPTWFDAEATPENARRLLIDHINKVAGRYAGRMHSWDVVNEAVYVQDGRPDGLRLTPFLKLIGDDYIELAFKTAREADPRALLTYNDYGIEGEDAESQAKRTAVLILLRRLRARNVPLDAVGVQSHLSAGAGPQHTYGAGLREFLAEVKELGLQVFITEMDVNDRELPADSAMRDSTVAAVYGSYLDRMLRDSIVTAVLTWGITDRFTWLNGEDARADHLPQRCLPFDAELRPVPAFFAMRTAYDRRRRS